MKVYERFIVLDNGTTIPTECPRERNNPILSERVHHCNAINGKAVCDCGWVWPTTDEVNALVYGKVSEGKPK